MKKNSEEIHEAIQDIFVETFKVEKTLIKKGSLLKDDLGLDSVDLLDAVGLAEKRFGIKILEEGSLRTKWPLTVEDLIRIIEGRLQNK